ncbi:MAG: hypothetical protein ACRDGI_10390 [Candidatus Limnocylindrales bacterium]
MSVETQDLERPPSLLSLRALLVACVIGLVFGTGAFLLTSLDSGPPTISYCLPTSQAGFDPLTGTPHGASFNCPQLTGLGGQVSVPQNDPIPAGLIGRRAIPVPLGFLVGTGISIVSAALISAWRRRST